MSGVNEGRCCDAVICVIEEREKGLRRIDSIDSSATPGVDVRCEIAGGVYALEHTTLDPYPNRRADDQQVLAVLEPLTRSIEQTGMLLPHRRYRLLVDIHAFRDISRGAFARIRDQLQAWVMTNVKDLVPSESGRAAVRWAEPPDVPVRILLQCYKARGLLRGKVTLARMSPENLEELRAQRIQETIIRKGPKLHAEHEAGAKAVLVLEDFDIALSNHVLIADPLHAELDRSGYSVDEIYLVDTSCATEWIVQQLRDVDRRWPGDNEDPPMWRFAPGELDDLMSTEKSPQRGGL